MAKIYQSVEVYSKGEELLSVCVNHYLDVVVTNDHKNIQGVNVFIFHIRSEDDERWEELFSYDNKNSSADFSQRANEVLSAETISRISNFGKEVSHPRGIPYSVRQEFHFAFGEAKRRMGNLRYSPTETDENYVCREQGFDIPYFDGTLHFSKEEIDEECLWEECTQFSKYEPYFVLPNGVYVFYPEQVFAFDENRMIIDWPE